MFHNPALTLTLTLNPNPKVYEGEVTELSPEETENPLGGYGRTVSHVVIGLKTTRGGKQLRCVRFALCTVTYRRELYTHWSCVLVILQ